MGAIGLNDILLTELQKISTKGGDVFHGMKSYDVGYEGFGEAYFSWINTGEIKAWKKHKRMTMNLIVPVGNVKFVFYGVGETGLKEFKVEKIGNENYKRITVPPGIVFGFQGISAKKSLILNIASIPHDPSEVERLMLDDIDYAWDKLP